MHTLALSSCSKTEYLNHCILKQAMEEWMDHSSLSLDDNKNHNSVSVNDSPQSNIDPLTRKDLLELFDGNIENLDYFLALRRAVVSATLKGDDCVCDPGDEWKMAQLGGWRCEPIMQNIEDVLCDSASISFNSKQIALEEGDAGESKINDDGGKETWRDSDGEKAQRESFACGVQGCSQTFSSLERYEAHYRTSHSYACASCRRTFVSDFLLDIHLQENHDSYFQILSSRIDMYRCLVESCDRKFRTAEQRKDHLVTEHKYPASFSFHRPLKEKTSKESSECEPGSAPSTATPSENSMDMDGDAKHMLNYSRSQGRGQQKGKVKDTGAGESGRIPHSICFGRGSQRAFQHKGRGQRKAGSQKHWHQIGQAAEVDTSVDIESVDMAELAECLDG